jgi:hypothetical protein
MDDLVKRTFHAPPTKAQLSWLARARKARFEEELAAVLAKEKAKEQPAPVEEQPLPLVKSAPIAMRPAGYEAPGGIAIYITAGVAGGFMAAIYGWPWTLAAYGLAGLTALACIGRARA